MSTRKFKYKMPINMFLKKHICPECSSPLKVRRVTKIVNSESEEAKDFDFSVNDGMFAGALVGDVKFIWYVYYCPKCHVEITNRDMKSHKRKDKGTVHPSD